jgi:hypothetical protein
MNQISVDRISKTKIDSSNFPYSTIKENEGLIFSIMEDTKGVDILKKIENTTFKINGVV